MIFVSRRRRAGCESDGNRRIVETEWEWSGHVGQKVREGGGEEGSVQRAPSSPASEQVPRSEAGSTVGIISRVPTHFT